MKRIEKNVAIKRDEEKVFVEEKGIEKYFEIKRDEEKVFVEERE